VQKQILRFKEKKPVLAVNKHEMPTNKVLFNSDNNDGQLRKSCAPEEGQSRCGCQVQKKLGGSNDKLKTEENLNAIYLLYLF